MTFFQLISRNVIKSKTQNFVLNFKFLNLPKQKNKWINNFSKKISLKLLAKRFGHNEKSYKWENSLLIKEIGKRKELQLFLNTFKSFV